MSDQTVFFDDSGDPFWPEFRRKNRESGLFATGEWGPDPAFAKDQDLEERLKRLEKKVDLIMDHVKWISQ